MLGHPPSISPLHKPIKACTNRPIHCHPSPLHNLLHTFDIKVGDYETITPVLQPPNQLPLFKTNISNSREEESKEADLADTSDAKVYTDGSGADGNVAASAALYKRGRCTKTLRYCLGPLANHTMFEAEATGVILALELLSKEKGVSSDDTVRQPGSCPIPWLHQTMASTTHTQLCT